MAALPRAARNPRRCMVPVAAFEAALGQAIVDNISSTLVRDLKAVSALGQKQTSHEVSPTSAFDPKRTSAGMCGRVTSHDPHGGYLRADRKGR